MRNHGGSGDYVEGERVFAPPAGSLDPDWVAGLVLDRMGVSAAVPRHVLAAAAQADGDARRRGVPEGARRQALTGLPAAVAREVVRAVEDFVAAYGVD
ncbi:hypothetical protein [Kineococcus rhizosphaerae]|uniref:Uncharacterized protein n=1 Tax=Kineococcus rhizosphaerae TaxID=559628 RepID=A0A2T0QZG7_9ACTN|nr:hypothetical protein [Kineococcus rhizosphaerae]PRY12088.1 hypothetical protein CLV37_11144 [Kineococcus rhizosphaerae]